MTFGEKIRRCRKEMNISQKELAFQLQVSRQAISKWENDPGYPETDKIIKLSKVYNVTLDYLLSDLATTNKDIVDDEKGFYVNQEMASGFLLHETLKYKKIAWSISLLLGGIAFVFLFQEVGVVLYVITIIAAIAFVVSIFLSGKPYTRLRSELLLFDSTVKNELIDLYNNKGKKHNVIILISIILFCMGFFILSLLTIFKEFRDIENIILSISMILAGTSVYFVVYSLGTLLAYRLLGKNIDRQD